MFLLDWRLAVFSLALTPVFVLIARRVGNQRKQITAEQQGVMADISSLVQESLSVSGILLGKSMGRGAELADRFERESAGLADLEVRSRMAGPLDDGDDPDVVRGHAGARLPVRRARRRRRLDRHRRRVHDAADAHLLADPVAAQRRRRHPELVGAVRARVRVPRHAGRHPPGRARAGARRAATSRSTTSGSATRPTTPGRSPASTSTSRRARAPRSSARPARARRRSATSSRGSTTPSAARSGSTASTCAS